MSIQESGEMYLETIFVLSKSGKGVRAIDVGEYMGFSKPSVSRAMSILKSGGYVETDEQGFLKLTAAGLEIAERTYERHTLLTAFFEAIGVKKDIAAQDACRIEHHISEASFQALKRHMSSLEK